MYVLHFSTDPPLRGIRSAISNSIRISTVVLRHHSNTYFGNETNNYFTHLKNDSVLKLIQTWLWIFPKRLKPFYWSEKTGSAKITKNRPIFKGSKLTIRKIPGKFCEPTFFNDYAISYLQSLRTRSSEVYSNLKTLNRNVIGSIETSKICGKILMTRRLGILSQLQSNFDMFKALQ